MICTPAQCDLYLCALNILSFLWPQEIPSFLASQSLLRQFPPLHAKIHFHFLFFFGLGHSKFILGFNVRFLRRCIYP